MKKLNELATLGLIAGALSGNACGGRTELSTPDDFYADANNAGTAGNGDEQPVEDAGTDGETLDGSGGIGGAAGSAGEAGSAGSGGSAGTAGEGGMGGVGGIGGTGGTGPQIGTLTIATDYDPPAIVAEKQDAQIAHFKIEADQIENQLMDHIRLKVLAVQCDGTGIHDPIYLYREGNSSPSAVGSYQDQGGYKAYLDFTFPTPHLIGKGDTAFFQVIADQNAGCCHFTEETFLENASDLTAKGATYGLPSTINNQYSENNPHSSVEIWGGSIFVDYYTQQPSLNIPIGTIDAACVDATVYNCLPTDLALSGLQAQLEITNGDGTSDAKDLLNNNPAHGNFTSIKLLERENSGVPLNTALGPNELNPAGSDVTQLLQLSGNAVIPAGERANLSVSFNVEENQALVGNQIRCTLKNLTSQDLVGPVHTMVDQNSPCLTVSPATIPPGGTLQPGAQDIEIACWDLQNSCYQTNLTALTAEHFASGNYNDLNALGLYMYNYNISDFSNIDPSGKVTFTNLTDAQENNGFNIHSGALHRLCVHTNVSFSATSGSQHGLQISAPTDLTTNPPTSIGGQFPVQGPTFLIGNK